MTTDSAVVPDIELMAAVVRGDTAAFAALHDRHADTVYRAAYRRLGDRRLTDDVVQDVWVTCWDRAELFDPTAGTLPAWLTTIARNRAVDRLRALGRRPDALPLSAVFATDDRSGEDWMPGQVLVSGGTATDPALVVDELALRDLMHQALGGLPADERTALELAYYGGLSQSEVASQLGIPLGTVKTRTRRALQRLRAQLSAAGLVTADAVIDGTTPSGDGSAPIADQREVIDGPR
ncbi:MAG: sigma-70 family RNA polymerase sigma factor [Chloroflexi bacterium]|nr:sigma-70 family RNA polymerase sigma factor [Chloroflexota bacterium]